MNVDVDMTESYLAAAELYTDDVRRVRRRFDTLDAYDGIPSEEAARAVLREAGA